MCHYNQDKPYRLARLGSRDVMQPRYPLCKSKDETTKFAGKNSPFFVLLFQTSSNYSDVKNEWVRQKRFWKIKPSEFCSEKFGPSVSTFNIMDLQWIPFLCQGRPSMTAKSWVHENCRGENFLREQKIIISLISGKTNWLIFVKTYFDSTGLSVEDNFELLWLNCEQRGIKLCPWSLWANLYFTNFCLFGFHISQNPYFQT